MTEATAAEVASDVDPRVATLERRIVDMEIAHRDRLARVELKAEAMRAGMVDLDGLKLIDPAALEYDADGQVRNLDGLMKTLRRTKPWLFGAASTSSTAGVPPAQPPEPKRATDMSVSEWKAARAALIKHR